MNNGGTDLSGELHRCRINKSGRFSALFAKSMKYSAPNVLKDLFFPAELQSVHSWLTAAWRGGRGRLGPVDIAIGDGKNVSVNVTALSVPFPPKRVITTGCPTRRKAPAARGGESTLNRTNRRVAERQRRKNRAGWGARGGTEQAE